MSSYERPFFAPSRVESLAVAADAPLAARRAFLTGCLWQAMSSAPAVPIPLQRVRRSGFSLVEVTLALGVAAFCLVVVFGLIPVGMKSNQAAVEQTAASGILSAVIADLRATPATLPQGQQTASQQFAITIPANPVAATQTATLYFNESGEYSQTLGADSRYRLTVTFPPNGTNAKTATFVNLKVSWPAAADASQPQPAGSTQIFAALDRN